MGNKSLDFNELQRPVLELTMQDTERTKIRVSTPTENLVEELELALPELQALPKAGNAEALQASYNLAAKLINCNRSFITVTAEELRNKYKMDLESLIVFFTVYMDFINEIYNAKN